MLAGNFRKKEALLNLRKLLITEERIIKEAVAEATAALPANRFDEVIKELRAEHEEYLRRAERAVTEVHETARADHQFSPGGLPEFMGDFYDNEARNARSGAARVMRAYDELISFLQALKSEREETP